MGKLKNRQKLKGMVAAKILETFEKLNHPMPRGLVIQYGHSRRNTGEYRIRDNRLWFNIEVLEGIPEAFIANTVPHEVAHVVACAMSDTCKFSPHNSVWQGLMVYLGLEPNTKASYMQDWRLPSNNFRYVCLCPGSEYHFKANIHRDIKKGLRGFRCKKCGECATYQPR